MQLINVALRRNAAPASARAFRPSRAPSRARLLRRRRPRGRAPRGHACPAGGRGGSPRHQVPPPPGRRPPGRGSAGQRQLVAGRARRGDRAARTGTSCSACSGTPRPTERAPGRTPWWRRRAATHSPQHAGSASSGRSTRRSPRARHILPHECGGRAGGRSSEQPPGRSSARGWPRRSCASVSARPPIVMQAVAFAAPLGLCVAVPRSRGRDVAACGLQMWAYLAAYKTPHDDPLAQERRVHVDYPILADRALGLGELPIASPPARAGSRRARGRGMAGSRPRARLGALDVVHGPARLARSTSSCAIRSASRGPP